MRRNFFTKKKKIIAIRVVCELKNFHVIFSASLLRKIHTNAIVLQNKFVEMDTT